MLFLISISPIVLVIFGVVGLNKPAKWVSVIVALFTILLSLYYFDIPSSNVFLQTKNGVIDGIKMVYMIWAAFLILQMLIRTGAMDKIKNVISDFTTDRRKQLIIIAFSFVGFLEGVAGAGTPAAVAAPFLVALGFPPLQAASSALIFNGIAASLGAAGLTTIGGFTPFLSHVGKEAIETMVNGSVPYIGDIASGAVNVEATIMNISMVTGCIHFFGALVAPLLVTYILFGKEALDREFILFCLITGFSYGISLVLVGTFVGAEFPTIIAGLVSFIVAIIYITLFNKNFSPPEKYLFNLQIKAQASNMSALKALSTYIILLLTLPLVRFFAPKAFINLGFPVWIGTTIFAVCLVGSFILSSTHEMGSYMVESFKSVTSALIAMSSLLVLANLMQVTGMLSTIAKVLATVTGSLYPAFTVIIGSLGSFITGTTTGSNIMFSSMHFEASALLGLSVPVILASQSAGAALGNMICTNNVVAVCATVQLENQEGLVMKTVFKPILVFWTIYALLALIYVYFIFQNLPIVLR